MVMHGVDGTVGPNFLNNNNRIPSVPSVPTVLIKLYVA